MKSEPAIFAVALLAAAVAPAPSVRAAWVMEGVTRDSPASTGSSAAAINRAA